MNRFMKRACAMLLALVMCLSLISGLPFEAAAYEVDYTYDGNVVYNWGQREEVCDFLSPMAEDFYADNGMTYDFLASLSGASSTSDVPNSTMYERLQELMVDNHSYKTSYEATKDYYANTDCQNGGGKISSFYSGKEIGPAWGEGSWNREHTWPNSKGLGGQDENDIMMLRPTATSENSSRGNTAYGESSGYYDPNSASGGTHNLHGDVARIWLYVYVRWGNTSYAWGKSGVMESKEVLLKWMEEDPVDTWEMGRNDSVESITGTRNVFVDYPELAFLMFNEDVPAGYTTPSGEGNSTAYTITATSNNTSYGTVSLNGRTITATPKTGYYVKDYTLTSGTATVTQNGNTFNVQASSDCAVRINFAAKTSAQVVYMEDGIQARTASSYQGDAVTLSAHTGTVPEGYSFVGWLTGELAETTTKPAAVYAPGTSYTITAATQTFYALYSRTEGGTGSTEYVLTDLSEITADDTVVITMQYESTVYALPNDSGSSSAPGAVTVTAGSGKLTDEPAARLLWNVEATSGGYIFRVSGGTSTLYCENANNGVRIGSNSANVFALDAATGYLKHNGTGRYVGVYRTNPDWRCYTSQTTNIGNQTLGFYVKGQGGTTYYTTDTYICPHEDTSNVAAVAPTCTETGFTAGVYCSDCDRYISGHQVVAANGHSYNSVVTKPTATEQGYTTYTCSVCSDSYVSDYTEALGYVYTVSFSVPTGVTAVEDMDCGKNGITLPSAGAPEGYTFLGWSLNRQNDVTELPTVYEAGTAYTAQAETVFYALYSYTAGGTGSTEYVLTDISEITAADVVVITMTNSTGTFALPNNAASTPSAIAVAVEDGKLTEEPADTLKWNVGGDASGYSFYPNGITDKWLYCTDDSKGVKLGTVADSFVIDSGYLKSDNGGRYMGVYGSKDWRCYANTTTNIGGQTLGFYVKGQGGTTYYTTLDAAAPSGNIFAIWADGQEIAAYKTLEQALASYDPSGEYIKLLDNAEVDLVLDDTLYIDLNGKTLTGIMDPDGCMVYGMDSTTDSYTCDNMGLFACVDTEGDPVVPAAMVKTSVTGAVMRYLTIETEDGYTFHRFYMGITHANLKPGTKGVGYKAVFAGDEMVKACIDSFGYTLQLGDNTPVTASKAGTELVSLDTVTLRVENYDAENMGQTELTASVYMVINGEKVSSSTVSITLKDLVEQINANNNLTADQKEALAAWISQSETMQTWDVGNIYTAE